MHVLSHLKQGLNCGTVDSHAAARSELIKFAFVVEHGSTRKRGFSFCKGREGGGGDPDTGAESDRPACAKTSQKTKIFSKNKLFTLW